MTDNRLPYIYPEYIRQILHHLVECTESDKYPLLYEKADLIAILYNQFNDYPITDQVYSLVWLWANKMVEAGSANWMKAYWSLANQYYAFNLENKRDETSKSLFREFHVMIGALLTYKQKFDQLGYIMAFTNSLPAKYPLIPSTLTQILGIYEELSGKNQMMYLLKYSMIGMYTGAGEENRIEGTLIDYLALLLIRLHIVNDYNITFSDPLAMPPAGSTIEGNDRKIFIADTFIRRIEQWGEKNEGLKACGLPQDGVARAINLLKQYKNGCKTRQNEISSHPTISEDKRAAIKSDLIAGVHNSQMGLPFRGLSDDGGELFVSAQEVRLDQRLILEGYDFPASNLGEAMVNAIYTQLRQFYCFQFLLKSPCVSYTVPYRDMGAAMKRLSLKKGFCILALGVSPHFFDETEGFSRPDGDTVKYSGIDVVSIPANNNYLLIMKQEDVPKVVVRPIAEDRRNAQPDEKELEDGLRLYSNIDTLTQENPTLTTSMTFGVVVAEKLKYARIQIAYHLVSDDMLVRNIEPISNYIV